MDRSHPKETGQQHHPAGTTLEPPGQEKEGSSQELLEKRCRVPNEKLGPHLGHFRKICPGQNPMEDGRG